jgi:polysaccharide pyruvyl transferase WcaK-like protein
MKIVVEQSHYSLENMGDLSMLQVAVSRLVNLWSDAAIHIFIVDRAEDSLQEYFPQVHPLNPSGIDVWLTTPLSERLYQMMPNLSTQEQRNAFEWKVRHHQPSLARLLMKQHLNKRRRLREYQKLTEFLEAIYDADLFVATGGGYITDTFERKANRTLEMLSLATRLRKPTVMLGHGLGPLQNPRLKAKAKAVLPKVDFISLREKRAGIPLLQNLGISSKRVLTTGDDAIELVYQNRSLEVGDGIGVNLRVANYSDIGKELIETVRSALHDAAAKKGASLYPVPIEFYEANSDVRTIQQLLEGYDDTCDGGESLRSPVKVIQQIGKCRVVVTGSYHAGVFALAQGIPVIGLAKSEYYKDKFLGLANQFGVGCEIIFLDDPQLREKIFKGINLAWQQAEELRPQLLEAARQQMELGQTAYQKVYSLVESRR